MESINFNKYLIVGTGPSVQRVSKYDFQQVNDDVIIVSVNSSILFLPKADIWFTLDDSFRNKKYAEIAYQNGIPVVMALDLNANSLKNKPYYFLNRRSKPKYLKRNYPETPEGWFARWGCMGGLSEDTKIIHSGNSLAGALNLVYFDRPKKVGLLGLDGSLERSVGGGHHPNNLSHLPVLFSSYKEQLDKNNIEVRNGSPNSSVQCFDRCKPRELIKWINSE